MIVVKRKVHLVRTSSKTRAIRENPRPTDLVRPGRVPRISRLMALAIHFDRLLRDGKVTDFSELAGLTHVTQPRITQIMNLNLLAPNIQEELLYLPPITSGREPIHEKLLRRVAETLDWAEQRARWSALCSARLHAPAIH